MPNNPIHNVLVVGGYGTIGQMVCTRLCRQLTGDVIVAGRTLEKARRFAATADGLRPARVDATDPSTFADALQGVDAVVMCLDADDSALAEACFRRGIHYVDVSPTDALLREVEACDDMARAHGAVGLLSVGLSPGITNLFVTESARRFDTVWRVDITLLLGLGEAFGPDTIKWTIEDALRPFSTEEHGHVRRIQPFSERRTVDLPGWGRRRAYRVNLADQHVLMRTTDLPAVATRLCYSSRLVTAYVALLNRMGLFRPLASTLGADRVTAFVKMLPFGADESVIQTEVTGVLNGKRGTRTRWVRGTDQAAATACVASAAVRQLHRMTVEGGVYHLHEQFAAKPFVNAIQGAGYAVDGYVTQ
jgi:saccharopine dehydrogenase-like NADP-dependent oxidoreductase